jgi:hypothetical protein
MGAAPRAAAVGLALAFGCAGGAASQPVPGWPLEPTGPALVDAMLRLAEVSAADVVHDPRCGDGRVVVAAARKFGARAVCVEPDAAQIERAAWHVRLAGVGDRVRLVLGDPLATEVGEATVLVLYRAADAAPAPRSLPPAWRRPGVRIVWLDDDLADAGPPERSERVGDRTLHLRRLAPPVR